MKRTSKHIPRDPSPGRHAQAPRKLRVIGGTLRNSRLQVLDAPGLRPTPERVRETLFNWLQTVVEGSRCLDLYAGTGALGIEAASRGAREVVLVESDVELARAIGANLTRLKIDNARIDAQTAERFLAGKSIPFDIVFLDPPYAAQLLAGAAARLEADGWLAPGAYVYVESPRALVPDLPASWTPWREGHAGEVRFALYRRRD